MKSPRLVIAGTNSGVGKTTITIGLMAAFRRNGYAVQGFKAGPDFIDPGYHTAVTGRASRNLDSWMTDGDAVKEIFCRGSRGADLSIIEGVMGLYDGKEPGRLTGSTAEIAMLLQAPVILALNVESMAGSAAAVVLGFQMLEPGLRIAGVIVNRVGSEGHYRIVKKAIEDRCGIPVVGYLQRKQEIGIPERHLGLIPALESGGLDRRFDDLADLIGETIDLEQLLRIAGEVPELEAGSRIFSEAVPEPDVAIAVARDAAFHFYYPENLELLEQCGARLMYFSPLAGEPVPPQAAGLYVGGGFPEEYAAELSLQKDMLRDLRTRIQAGLPTFAECGGYMLLAESITDRRGETHAMAGVVPGAAAMQTRFAALGYREVTGLVDGTVLGKGDIARGHEFHYSVMHDSALHQKAYEYDYRGERRAEGFSLPNLTAGYIHLHFCSNPGAARRFVEACREYDLKQKEGEPTCTRNESYA